MKNNNPTTTIKCKFSNKVHQVLEPNINVPGRLRYKNKKTLTDKEKLEIFEKIVTLHDECSSELTNYQYDRRKKKRVNKERIERGWKPKKNTKKEDYLESTGKVLV